MAQFVLIVDGEAANEGNSVPEPDESLSNNVWAGAPSSGSHLPARGGTDSIVAVGYQVVFKTVTQSTSGSQQVRLAASTKPFHGPICTNTHEWVSLLRL